MTLEEKADLCPCLRKQDQMADHADIMDALIAAVVLQSFFSRSPEGALTYNFLP